MLEQQQEYQGRNGDDGMMYLAMDNPNAVIVKNK